MWWMEVDQTIYENSVATPVTLPGTLKNQIVFGVLLPNEVSYGDEIEFPSSFTMRYRDFFGFEETLSFSLEAIEAPDSNFYEWRVDAYDSGLGFAAIGTYTIRLIPQDGGVLSMDFFSGPPDSASLDNIVEGAFDVSVSSGRIGISFEHLENTITVDDVDKYGPIWNSVTWTKSSPLTILTNPFEEPVVTSADGHYVLDVSDKMAAFQIYLDYGKIISGADRVWPKHIDHALGSSSDDRLIGNIDDNYLHGWSGNDILKSGGGNDTLKGGWGDDKIIGGEGEDFLDGGRNNDWMSGFEGNDLLYGGHGQDTIKAGRGDDLVYGGEDSDFLYGNLGNDSIVGQTGDDQLFGGGGQDTLVGGDGDDYLSGENGADILFGGLGDDVLIGGASGNTSDNSADVFVFSPGSEDGGGFDRIRGFEDGLDMIDLSAFGYSSFSEDVLSRAIDRSFGLKIDWGEGNVLFIESFNIESFDASDVIL